MYNLIDVIQKDYDNKNEILQLLPSDKFIQQFDEYNRDYNDKFLIDKLEYVNFNNNNNTVTQNIFSKGLFKDIDELENDIQEIIRFVDNFKNKLESMIGKENSVKLEKNDKYGYHFTVTSKRFKIICDKYNWIIKGTTGTTKKITTTEMETSCNRLLTLQNRLSKLIKTYYFKTIDGYSEKYNKLFIELSKFISSLDVVKSNAGGLQEWEQDCKA